MTLIITWIRESFDVRNRERVCLLEGVMKATLLIYAEKCVFKWNISNETYVIRRNTVHSSVLLLNVKILILMQEEFWSEPQNQFLIMRFICTKFDSDCKLLVFKSQTFTLSLQTDNYLSLLIIFIPS